MQYMVCRNKVKDFAHWHKVFQQSIQDNPDVGFTLMHLWQQEDDLNQVHFIFSVEDRARTEAFINSPEAAKTGQISGVIDGEIHFVIDPKS